MRSFVLTSFFASAIPRNPGWRKAHPAGAHWIDWYDGRDATDVMDAFHSNKARNMYQRLPKSKPETAAVLDATVAPYSQTEINFRKLRDQLETDGWWERDFMHEAKLLAIWTSLMVGAGLTAQSAPPLSTFLLGLAMTNAGWLGHDYIHGVDKFSNFMRPFAAVAAGLGPTWWSDKHNKHHALSEFGKMFCVKQLNTRGYMFVSALLLELILYLFALIILRPLDTSLLSQCSK